VKLAGFKLPFTPKEGEFDFISLEIYNIILNVINKYD
jgi:hypothetical protein